MLNDGMEYYPALQGLCTQHVVPEPLKILTICHMTTAQQQQLHAHLWLVRMHAYTLIKTSV